MNDVKEQIHKLDNNLTLTIGYLPPLGNENFLTQQIANCDFAS